MSLHARTASHFFESNHHWQSHPKRTRLRLPASAKARQRQNLPALRLQKPLGRPRPIHTPQLTSDIYDDDDLETSTGCGDSLSAPADILRLMDLLQVPVEADVYEELLQECAASADAEQGAAIHAHLRRGGGRHLRGQDAALVADRLLLMYCACGRTNNALELFDKMPQWARVPMTWAILVAGLSDNGEPGKAIRVFVEMLKRGILVHPACCICMGAILESCAALAKFRVGQCVHGLVLKLAQNGIPGGNHTRRQLGSSLMQFYCQSGRLESARRVLNEMGFGSSNAACAQMMIEAYCRASMFHEALGVFKATRTNAVRKNNSVVVTVLKACGNLEADEGIRYGAQLHAAVIKTRMDADQFVQLGLVRMYGRLGRLGNARKAFDLVSGRKDDEACWKEMLDAYVRSGHGLEAMRLLYEMKAAGLKPGESMVVDAKLACGCVY